MAENDQKEDEQIKDPLDFDATRLAARLAEWSLDPKHNKNVKQMDREEIDFLNSMVKYEQHFSEDEKIMETSMPLLHCQRL